MVDFSREGELKAAPCGINDIVETSLDLVRHMIKFDKIIVERDMRPGLPLLNVDKGKIEQVLVNILQNAVHAMPAGGSIYLRTRKSVFGARPPAAAKGIDRLDLGQEMIEIEVEDTGRGIAKDNMDKVFEPFFTTKDPGKGTGLGLPVCANIIEMHKGAIEIRSEEGKGAKVTIILPVINA
jgi:signal transduction histidine kinase